MREPGRSFPLSVLSALFVALPLAVLSACSSNNAQPSEGTSVGPAVQGAATCQRNEPGCACAAEGKRIACGKVSSTDSQGNVTCGQGGQVCTGGKWSECVIDSYAPGHDGVATQSLGTATACTDACDIYCKSVTDTADNTIPLAADSGLTYVDGGISLNTTPQNPDGGISAADLAILQDSGGLPDSGPDGSALIFHELLPGQTAQDPVVLIPGEIPSTDIYFLLDDTASMYDESAALTSAIQDTSGNNMIQRIRAIFGNSSDKVQFGFGRFEEYKQTKYVVDSTTNVPFQHILSITGDNVAAGVAAKWIREDSYGATGASVLHSGGTFPEATIPALTLLATGGNDPTLGYGAAKSNSALSFGSPVCNPANWWVMPRVCWPGTAVSQSYFVTNGATAPAAEYPVSPAITVPCPAVSNPPAGYNSGFPCWRPNKTPIVIIMTDAPGHNGPGGQYSYDEETGYAITYASSFPNATTAPSDATNDGSSFSKATPLTLPAVGSGAVYYGTVPSRASGSSVGGGIARTETSVDATGASFTARRLVQTFPTATTMTVGDEYRSTIRDCSLATSYSVCVAGSASPVTYAQTNASTSITQTTDTIGANINAQPTSTVATSAPTSSSYYATASSTGYSAGTATCTVTTTSAASATPAYTLTSSGTVGTAGMSLPTALTQIGSVALTSGQYIKFTLTLVADGQNPIDADLRVLAASAPTASTGTVSSHITNSTTAITTANYYATANQSIYVAADRNTGTASFPQVTITYQVYSPAACPANTITIAPTGSTTAQACWTCKSGYTYTATCGASTARAGLAGCFLAAAPSCSVSGTSLCGGVTGSPATAVAGSTMCCTPKNCASGTVLNGAGTACVACPAAYPVANGSPPTLCAVACASGFQWDNSSNANNCVKTTCPTGTPAWSLDLGNHRCLQCPNPVAPTTPAYTLTASTATCSRNYCPTGYTGPSGGNCTQQSCVSPSACATNYTCSGVAGAAKCTGTCALCPSGTTCSIAGTTVTCTYPTNSCYSSTTANKGDGYRAGDQIFKFTVPVKNAAKANNDPSNRYFYHFGLLRTAAGTSNTTDANAFLYIKPATSTDADVATNANPDGNVYDCNRDANKWNVIGFTGETDRYVRSEVNSYLMPGDYYLVVDNLVNVAAGSNSAAYNYILQVGAFDDATPFAAPSYKQAITALNSIGAKTIGIDSSGVSCQQAGLSATNPAQYETRALLEQIGRDTGSVDGVTGKPFVVPIRQNAADCDPASTGTNGLQSAVESAVTNLTATLRSDISLRAVFANQAVTAPVFVPPSAPSMFIQSVTAVSTPDVTANCGSVPTIQPIGADSIAGYQKFNVCLPGTGVTFQVVFQMPTTIPRLSYDQYFRFDLVVLRGVGEVSRIPVVLKLPKLPVPGDFYRDYDMTNVCPDGTRIVYDRFAWNSDDPLTDPANSTRVGSKIDMSVIMGTSQANLVALTGTASEKSLATAKASPYPANTEVSSALLGPVLNYQRQNFLRVHFRLSPSVEGSYPNNAIYVPTLHSWQLYVSCPPTE